MEKRLSIEEKDLNVEEFLIWKSFPMGAFFYKNRRKLLILASALLILDIMLATFLFPGPKDLRLTGGVYACVLNADEAPYSGEVHLSGAVTTTDDQGCFIFTGLQPGVHSLTISVSGTEYREPVRVNAGEAASLGVINLE